MPLTPTPVRCNPLRPLYRRVYARTDLPGSPLKLRLICTVGALWLLCGTVHGAVLSHAWLQPHERAACRDRV